MADLAGETDGGVLRLDFDRRVMLRFNGSAITSDGVSLGSDSLGDRRETMSNKVSAEAPEPLQCVSRQAFSGLPYLP
jgi:hypothetical protein